MPRVTKIYTRKGDDGSTALGSGQRVPKDSVRVQACGTVDELNSLLGLARAHDLDERLEEELGRVQNELFHLGSCLAFPQDEARKLELPQIEKKHIERLEGLIDDLWQQLGPLDNFILPGGGPGAATLHLARAVCRRAERTVVTLAREEGIRGEELAYLNRLSDALFAMARYENRQKGRAERLWDSHT